MLQPLIIITKHSIDNMFYNSSLLAWFPFAKGFVKKNGKISCGETFTQQCKTYCITFTSLHIHHKIDNSAMCVDNIYNVEWIISLINVAAVFFSALNNRMWRSGTLAIWTPSWMWSRRTVECPSKASTRPIFTLACGRPPSPGTRRTWISTALTICTLESPNPGKWGRTHARAHAHTHTQCLCCLPVSPGWFQMCQDSIKCASICQDCYEFEWIWLGIVGILLDLNECQNNLYEFSRFFGEQLSSALIWSFWSQNLISAFFV